MTRKRVIGWLSYLLLFAVVAGALILVFAQFTGSKLLAFGLVGFMVAYMALMGWLASKRNT